MEGVIMGVVEQRSQHQKVVVSPSMAKYGRISPFFW
jgi:hypothetical protein